MSAISILDKNDPPNVPQDSQKPYVLQDFDSDYLPNSPSGEDEPLNARVAFLTESSRLSFGLSSALACLFQYPPLLLLLLLFFDLFNHLPFHFHFQHLGPELFLLVIFLVPIGSSQPAS